MSVDSGSVTLMTHSLLIIIIIPFLHISIIYSGPLSNIQSRTTVMQPRIQMWTETEVRGQGQGQTNVRQNGGIDENMYGWIDGWNFVNPSGVSLVK